MTDKYGLALAGLNGALTVSMRALERATLYASNERRVDDYKLLLGLAVDLDDIRVTVRNVAAEPSVSLPGVERLTEDDIG